MECYVFWKSVGLACDIVKEALKRLQRDCKVDAGHSIPLVISRPGRDLPARNYTRLILRDSEASYSMGLVIRGLVGSVIERGHTVETESASRLSPTTRFSDIDLTCGPTSAPLFTMKLSKLAMKLPPSLTRLWTPGRRSSPPEVSPSSSAAALEVESEAFARFSPAVPEI